MKSKSNTNGKFSTTLETFKNWVISKATKQKEKIQ